MYLLPLLLFVFAHLTTVRSPPTNNPNWIPNGYMDAASYKIIDGVLKGYTTGST